MEQELETTELSRDERTWGMICHLSSLAGFILPLGSVLGPLVVWLVKKEESPFIDDQGKEALNFQITMALAVLVSALLMIVLVGFLLLPVVLLFDLVFTIIAAIKANDGVTYRYPFALRLVT